MVYFLHQTDHYQLYDLSPEGWACFDAYRQGIGHKTVSVWGEAEITHVKDAMTRPLTTLSEDSFLTMLAESSVSKLRVPIPTLDD